MKTALIVILALILVGGGAYAYKATRNNTADDGNIVCTMDAKLCPDGSYVGRIGPKCEFAPCPLASSNTGIQGTVVNSTTTTTTASTSTAPRSVTVTYTDSGFSPRTATVMQGGKITFVNKSSANMRVASDPHPQHTNYPDFDQMTSIGVDGTWTFTFNRLGVWGYHDHLNPASKGTVIVK